MAETIIRDIGSFLQDSCLKACQAHPDEQISYINISPYDVENRFLCIQCRSAIKLTQEEEQNYLISLRMFILKQQQEPHFKILSEEARLQVQETLQTKGRVNLREKIQQFSDRFVEMITEELMEIQKIADEKTQLVNEKKEAIESNYNELTNPSSIFDIFDQNRHNIESLNEQIDNYIKLSYVKVKQLQEGNEEYEELFNEFNLDEAEIVKEKIQSKVKQIRFYIPSANGEKNGDKSIFEENPIFIDDSSLSLKGRAFLKLLQQIPNINPSLLMQIEKKLIGNPIFEDVDFENEEELQENNEEQEVILNKEENNEQVYQFSNVEGKQMAINDAISPIQKISQQQKMKSKIVLNKGEKEEISEKELSEFISNALNDEIPYNQFQNNKNHFRNKSAYPNNSNSQQQTQSQLKNEYNSLFQSTPPSGMQQPNKQENYYYSQVMHVGYSSNSSENVSFPNRLSDQKEKDGSDISNINPNQQMSRIPLQLYAQDQTTTQVYQNITNMQQSVMVDVSKIQQQGNAGGYRNTEEGITLSMPQNQNQRYLQMQKHQSANYDNYFMNHNINDLALNQNSQKLPQSKSRDQSPNNKQAVYTQKSEYMPQQYRDNNFNNIEQIESKQPIKEEEDEHKASIVGSSGFTMKEFEDFRTSQQEAENKQQIQQQKGLLQIDGQRFILRMKKSRLGSTESINISHQQNNTIIIDSPSDSYAHYINSKDILEPSKEYAILFSIRCAKNDSVLIGITPKEYINEKVLHKMPFYKSFVNTQFETFSSSCERVEKGKSIKCNEEISLHVVMRVSIANETLSFSDFPKMENINSIKNPADLKSVKQFYLTVGLTKSKESFNNPSLNPLRIQVLDMRTIEQNNNADESNNINNKSPTPPN